MGRPRRGIFLVMTTLPSACPRCCGRRPRQGVNGGQPARRVPDAPVFLGGSVNYFNRFGRVWQVYVQAEGESRTRADDVGQFYVRNAQGNPVPLSSLVTMRSTNGPEFTLRYNEYRSAQINGILKPGVSTSQGRKALEEVFAQTMPSEMGFDYMGMSYQEQAAARGVPASAIFGFSLLVVFLILAAQYQSWSLPSPSCSAPRQASSGPHAPNRFATRWTSLVDRPRDADRQRQERHPTWSSRSRARPRRPLVDGAAGAGRGSAPSDDSARFHPRRATPGLRPARAQLAPCAGHDHPGDLPRRHATHSPDLLREPAPLKPAPALPAGTGPTVAAGGPRHDSLARSSPAIREGAHGDRAGTAGAGEVLGTPSARRGARSPRSGNGPGVIRLGVGGGRSTHPPCGPARSPARRAGRNT
jgi:hypothetical protein